MSMKQHRDALKYVWDIAQVVDRWESEGQAVRVWRDCLADWTAFVVVYPTQWRGVDAASSAKAGARVDMLRALDQLLEGTTQKPEAGQLQRIEQFLTEIIDALAADETISDALRGYILALVQEIQAAVQAFRVTGAFDADKAVRHLWVGLGAAAEESASQSGLWQNLRSNILIPASVGLIANIPGVAMTAISGG